MTPIPVPDESMPDAIADVPDTWCAIHECVGVQMLWNILRYSLFYHLLCLRKVCLQPHHHGLHLCPSPMKRRRCNNLSHLTMICNLSFHRQRPQMMIPCHFLTLMTPHHGFFRNQKHRGFLPSRCRCHPYRFLRHERRRTCPLVIQLFCPRHGSIKLHSHRQQFMKMFYHQSLRLTRLHLRQLRFQKLRRFLLWQNVGDLEHFTSKILYRSAGDPIRCSPRLLFRPQRLHSFDGAQVFCVLCVHFEDSETHNQIPPNV